MSTSESIPKLIQWKYFRISLVMYLLYYLLPIVLLFLATRVTALFKLAQTVGVSWAIGGVIVIAAVAAYRSKGVAFWEPALASVAMLILAMLALMIFDFVTYSVMKSPQIIRDIIGPIVTFFLLGLFGAWIGGRFQKVSKKDKLE
jgi:hypothetical protein